MKNKVLFFLTGIICAALLNHGCVREPDDKVVLVKINSYKLTVDDFNDELKHSLYAGDEDVDKESFLDFLVRKQLLIEEAQRQGIDRSEGFMKTIERYWKQTLIKELLGEQSARISRTIGEERQTEALNEWFEGLYEKADIEFDQKALEDLKKQ